MSPIYPILFVDLLKQSSYKNAILFSMMHKQMTYFSKKYSKSNRITLNIRPDYIDMDEIIKCDKDYHPYRYDPTKNVNKKLYKLFALCKKDNIKAIKCVKNNPKILNYIQRGGCGFFGFDDIMFYCAACGNIRIVRWFINNGYCLTHGAMMHFYQTTSSGIYCYFRTPKIVKLLLDKNVIYNNMQDDHDANNDTNRKFLLVHCNTALLSSTSNIMIIKILLDHGAKNDDTLEVCVNHERIDVLKLLLDRGANIHHDNDGAFVTSALKGNLEIIKFLISRGANIHADNDRALVFSASSGHMDVAKYLLDNNANVHAYGNDGALNGSIWNGHHKIAKLLLDKGANINIINIHYSLDKCNRYRYIETAKLLLDYGADITTITGVIHPDIKKYAKEKLKLI